MTKKRDRVVEQLRRQLGGAWRYDREMNEWHRDDGTRVYARAHIAFDVCGGESYYTRWYIELPGAPVEPLWGVVGRGAAAADPR